MSPQPTVVSRRGLLFAGAAASAATVFAPPAITALLGAGRADGASWNFYRSGTDTAAPVYADDRLAASLGSAVKADAAGRFPAIYLDSRVAYRAVLTDASGAIAARIDPLNPGGFGMSVLAFGAIGDGVHDDSRAFQAAADSGAACIWIPRPPAFFRLGDAVRVRTAGQMWLGAGWGSHVRQLSVERNGFTVTADNVSLRDLRIEGPGTATGVVSFENNNGVYCTADRGLSVEGCIVHGFGMNGLQVRNTDFARIEANSFFGNLWVNASGSDICFYSSTPTRGATVTGNRCLSNNSQGIYFNALGHDGDATITGNSCVTFDPTGRLELAGTAIRRRHGIIASYHGGGSGRLLVQGNICRNTAWTGIYSVATAAAGPMLILDNICANNGTDERAGLQGGIFVDSHGEHVIAGNDISDFRGTIGGGITFQSTSGTGQVTCRDNVVRGSRGKGIAAGSRLQGAQIRGNRISGTGSDGIAVVLLPGDASVGGLAIEANDIEVAEGLCAIRLDVAAGRPRNRIRANILRQKGKTRTSQGVIIVGQPQVDLIGNTIEGFRNGVDFQHYLTARTRYFNEFVISDNSFEECDVGVGAGAQTADVTLPLEGNRFNGTRVKAGGGTAGGYAAGYIASRKGDGLEIHDLDAAPRTGTWAAGDRAVAARGVLTPGSRWICAAPGSPGRWREER